MRAAAPTGACGVLTAAVLVLVLLAAFDHGAVGTASGARIELIVCALAALGAGMWLLRARELKLPVARVTLAGLALITVFAIWSGISLAWSVSPDSTWQELDRAVSYVLILAVAAGLGAASRRTPVLLADGFLIVVAVVTLYAIGQKLVPEFHLGSLLNLDQTGAIPRLQEPLGYWNALALFIALGFPVALFRGVDTTRGRWSRTVSLVAAQIMLVTIGLTLSRGGLLALVLALAIAMPMAAVGPRGLMWALVAVAATLPPLLVGLSVHALSDAGASLSSRAGAGAILTGVLLISVAALVWGSGALMALERRTRLGDAGRRRVNVMLGGLGLGVVLAIVLALALSSRGLDGELSHAWSSFTANPSGSIYSPKHLLSQDSEHRWVWWKEALGAFSDRPAAGWGAGSFGVVHLLYRQDRLSVNQPHSLPLQFLAETGVIGALVALAALALLVLAAVRAVRAGAPGRERLVRASLLAGGVAFLLHSLYDWDWDIPGVAIPALIMLGALAGSAPLRRRTAAEPDRESPAPAARLLPPARGAAVAAFAGIVLLLCSIALSDAVPSLAAGDAAAALVEAGGGGAAALQRAQADAVLAGELDPLSDAGLEVQSTIAVRRGELALARADLRAAISRDPTDVQAWQQLAEVDLLLGYLLDASNAAKRALVLDPQGLASAQSVFEISQIAGLLGAPPRDSATAIATPGSGSAVQGRPHAPGRPAATAPTPLKPLVPGVNTGASTAAGGFSQTSGTSAGGSGAGSSAGGGGASRPGGTGAGSGRSTGSGGSGGSGGSRGAGGGSGGSRGSGSGSSGSSGNSGNSGSSQGQGTTTEPVPTTPTPTTPVTTTTPEPPVTTPSGPPPPH